jgi:hypothetical protein
MKKVLISLFMVAAMAVSTTAMATNDDKKEGAKAKTEKVEAKSCCAEKKADAKSCCAEKKAEKASCCASKDKAEKKSCGKKEK